MATNVYFATDRPVSDLLVDPASIDFKNGDSRIFVFASIHARDAFVARANAASDKAWDEMDGDASPATYKDLPAMASPLTAKVGWNWLAVAVRGEEPEDIEDWPDEQEMVLASYRYACPAYINPKDVPPEGLYDLSEPIAA